MWVWGHRKMFWPVFAAGARVVALRYILQLSPDGASGFARLIVAYSAFSQTDIVQDGQ